MIIRRAGKYFFAINVLMCISNCGPQLSNAGGGSHASGSNSIAVGGATGGATQIVNISKGEIASAKQQEVIKEVLKSAFKSLIKYRDSPDKFSEEGVQKLYNTNRMVNTWETPSGFRAAHRKWVDSIKDFRKYYVENPEITKPIEGRAEWDVAREQLANGFTELMGAANDAGVDVKNIYN